MNIVNKELKTKVIRFSGRSSDFIFPSISQGCAGGCIYCYAARHTEEFRKTLKISTNLDSLIDLVKNHDTSQILKPNQTHDDYITWDIGCNSDISIDINYFDWHKVFDYFKNSSRDMATFATKFTNPKLLTYNPDRKVRVRMSLMPDKVSSVIEPKTSSIVNRIRFINSLYDAGYDVHVNFSPVIVFKGWLDHYRELFELLDNSITDKVKSQLRSEVIFLTHNQDMHLRNVNNLEKGEKLLWVPALQEVKNSTFGGENIRYQSDLKKQFIQEFSHLLNEVIPYAFIRYIF